MVSMDWTIITLSVLCEAGKTSFCLSMEENYFQCKLRYLELRNEDNYESPIPANCAQGRRPATEAPGWAAARLRYVGASARLEGRARLPRGVGASAPA